MTPMTTLDDRALQRLARKVARAMTASGGRVVTAESCTGGWIAKALTDIPGSSVFFETGFVTYGNAAKTALLGVKTATLEAHGAVSEAVVVAMARGALRRARADLAIAVSGIAGPAGGRPDKPVGTVWFALARRRGSLVEVRSFCCRFAGGREAVRRAAVATALRAMATP